MSAETVTSTTRPYRKRQRAEAEEATRRRIAAAAAELHEEIGPAQTTFSAVAERAGVQRGTVYRHFPDAESLFLACSAHWASLNPPPNPSAWAQIADPDERLRHALAEMYRWYEWAEPMLVNVTRDAEAVPALLREGTQQRREAAVAALLHGRRSRGRARAREAATIAHALDFAAWRSLVRQHGLEPDEVVELMAALVDAAAGAGPTRRSRHP